MQGPRPVPPARPVRRSLVRLVFVFMIGVALASVVNATIIQFVLFVAGFSDFLSWSESVLIGLAWVVFRFVDTTLFRDGSGMTDGR